MDQGTSTIETIWNKKDVVKFLRVSESTLNGWIATGYIPCVKMRRIIRFVPSEIREWMRSHTAGTEN